MTTDPDRPYDVTAEQGLSSRRHRRREPALTRLVQPTLHRNPSRSSYGHRPRRPGILDGEPMPMRLAIGVWGQPGTAACPRRGPSAVAGFFFADARRLRAKATRRPRRGRRGSRIHRLRSRGLRWPCALAMRRWSRRPTTAGEATGPLRPDGDYGNSSNGPARATSAVSWSLRSILGVCDSTAGVSFDATSSSPQPASSRTATSAAPPDCASRNRG